MLGQGRYLVEHPGASTKDEGMLTSGAEAAVRDCRKLVTLHSEEQRPNWDKMDAAEKATNSLLVRPASREVADDGRRGG